MTLNKAITVITSICHNLDGRMKYTYHLTKPNYFNLEMHDLVSGLIRHVNFELKKADGNDVDVAFTCHGFSFNFPLKKNVRSFTFALYNFELLLIHGIKVDPNSPTTEPDLDVEF